MNAFIATTGIYRDIETLDEQGALATAARLDREGPCQHPGPLWGILIVIKANTSIEGMVTTDGWKGYTIPGHESIAPKDAPIVARFRAAGAVILGHTNMPDFAASDTNRSSSFGRTGNAHDVRFSPRGSSGGTVTAVTSNEAVLGNGTDTGNSIRMPAATSAVVGFFPTRGLVPIAGIAPLNWLLDNTGPIARNVTDAAIALGVMAGPDSADPRTAEAATRAMPGPYTQYLKKGALKGRRFAYRRSSLRGRASRSRASVPSLLRSSPKTAGMLRALWNPRLEPRSSSPSMGCAPPGPRSSSPMTSCLTPSLRPPRTLAPFRISSKAPRHSWPTMAPPGITLQRSTPNLLARHCRAL